MKKFAELYKSLDETNKTNEKISILAEYFLNTPAEDAVWAVSFLTGRKPIRVINSSKLWQWALELSKLPDWLYAECYSAVGDLAETITLLLPKETVVDVSPLHWWVEEVLLKLNAKPEHIQKEEIISSWLSMNNMQRFVWNKLLTGAFRVGVSASIVIKGLAKASGLEESTVTHRMTGKWNPTAESYKAIISKDVTDTDVSKPYPFFLAYQLEKPVESLGNFSDWAVEWKWDGIRSQIIKREGKVFLWSRGEELITERFPELEAAAKLLPDGTAIDGEILAWADNKPMPFAVLQQRIGRKNLSRKIFEEVPIVFQAFDALEIDGSDIRNESYAFRREKLLTILNGLTEKAKTGDLFSQDKGTLFDEPKNILLPIIPGSVVHDADSWKDLYDIIKDARKLGVEGFILKKKDSTYGFGRKRGSWWKWKIDPFTVDAVLIYAARGSGRRASLYTDYTFGVWDNGELVPFAKAYSGLTDEEIRKVDSFIRRNTLEKFGPVRTVKPELVFELAFEAIQKSGRHKSGIAVRFPRISKWRSDKKPKDADTLDFVKALAEL